MRTIKFRAIGASAFFGKKGKWCYGSLVEDKADTYISDMEASYFKIDPDTLGQLTNCTTADGAEIYEGDKLVDDYLPGYYFVVYYDTEADAFRLYKRWPDGQILHYQEPLRISLIRYPNLRHAGTIHDDKLAANYLEKLNS